jgi:hypothetical protein
VHTDVVQKDILKIIELRGRWGTMFVLFNCLLCSRFLFSVISCSLCAIAVPFSMDIPNENGRGRPPQDYRLKYLALETRCKRAGLQPQSNEPFKKQLTEQANVELLALRQLVSNQQSQIVHLNSKIEKLEKDPVSSLLNHRERRKPYSQLSNSRKREIRSAITKVVGRNSGSVEGQKILFLRDILRTLPSALQIENALREILEHDKIGSVMQEGIVNKCVYHASRSELIRTRDFVERRRLQLSQAKKVQLNRSAKNIVAEITPEVSLLPVICPCSSKTDKAARAHLRNAFPVILPRAFTDDSLNFEHAKLDPEAVIRSALCLFYCTEEFHQHWHWFYSAQQDGLKLNHIELSTFYDSFPLGNRGEQCTGLYIRFLNAAV